MGYKEKQICIEEAYVVIRDKYGNIKAQHSLINNSILHKLLVKIGKAHDSLTTEGLYAETQLISGIGTQPAQFKYLCIGTHTSTDAVTDTYANITPACTKLLNVANASQMTINTDNTQQPTITWAWTFSAANDTGAINATYDNLTASPLTSVVSEVAILNGYPDASSDKVLLRISGANYNSGVYDTCIWSNGDTYALTLKLVIKQGS